MEHVLTVEWAFSKSLPPPPSLFALSLCCVLASLQKRFHLVLLRDITKLYKLNYHLQSIILYRDSLTQKDLTNDPFDALQGPDQGTPIY
jgi:hypothetical protein